MGSDALIRRSSILVVFALLVSVLIGSVHAEVVVFKSYETRTALADDRLQISRKIVLQNVGSNPIIPGELHFRLHEIRKGEKVASAVSLLQAQNDFDKKLNTRKLETAEETDIVVSVWEPVLPQFTYVVFLDYSLDFEPKGLLFYEITVPLEETTIPIKDQKQSLYLPNRYRVTYAPGAEVKLVEEDGKKYRVVTWSNREDMTVEYTVIPLPKMGIRAVNVFWMVVILALLAATFFIHKRLRA